MPWWIWKGMELTQGVLQSQGASLPIHVMNPNLQCVSGGEALGSDQAMQEGLMKGISACISSSQEIAPLPTTQCEDTGRCCRPSTDTESASTLSLAFPVSRARTKQFLLFMNHPLDGVLSWQPEWKKTRVYEKALRS